MGRERPSRHGPIAQLLIAWSPLSVILVAYAAAQWITAPLAHAAVEGDRNRLGLGLHVAAPAAADRAVFHVVPTVWLQARLVGGCPQWYDVIASAVYVTHFVGIPLLTAVVWFCLRDRFRAWIVAVVVFTLLGIGGYVLYPAAPPWLAAEHGVIGPVERISGRGWDLLHLTGIDRLVGSGQGVSNPVAAMPSLHAGAAMLVALFLWPSVAPGWRVLLLAYPALMAVALVYSGEHYVIDVVAGWGVGAVAVAAPYVGGRWAATGRRPGSR